MPQDSRKIPSHETTYARLRDMVLFGELAPGQPVTIQGLTEALGAGMTPVREALRRLTAEGALQLLGNRRVVVPRLTVAALEDLAFVRIAVERRLAAAACATIPEATIARLTQMEHGLDAALAAGDIHTYLESNHRFHFTLYEAAGSESLTEIARSLWLRLGPSLRVHAFPNGAANLPDTHAEALAAMRARNPEALADAIEHDIRVGVAQVRRALESGAV